MLRAALAAVASLFLLTSAAPAGAAVRVVAPGQVLRVNAGGFAPGAVVAVRTVGIVSDATVRADGGGTVHVSYRVPVVPGSYRLLLVGAARASRAGRATVTGTIGVIVPLVVTVPYRVVGPRPSGPGSGVGGVNQGPATSGPSAGVGGQSAGQTPAGTGTDLGPLLAVGVGALAVGLGLVAAGRRRSRR